MISDFCGLRSPIRGHVSNHRASRIAAFHAVLLGIMGVSCGQKGESTPQTQEPIIIESAVVDGIKLADANSETLVLTNDSTLDYKLQFTPLSPVPHALSEYILGFGCNGSDLDSKDAQDSWLRINDGKRTLAVSEQELGRASGKFSFALGRFHRLTSPFTCSFRILLQNPNSDTSQMVVASRNIVFAAR